MALKYVVKKTTFGFDKEKAEKYVARPFNVVTVDFKMLCDQVTKVGFVPRGTVKSVLDGLIDSLITYMEIGASVSLGEFGTFRPSFGCKSQDDEKGVTTESLRNRKIIFTPGNLFKGMIKSISIQKLDSSKTNSSTTPDDGNGDDKGEGGGSGEAPDHSLIFRDKSGLSLLKSDLLFLEITCFSHRKSRLLQPNTN